MTFLKTIFFPPKDMIILYNEQIFSSIKYIAMETFDISQCNISQIVGESTRFLFHVFLVHVSTCIIDKKDELFSRALFKTLTITIMAIVMYHIFFRKIIEPKIEKMKLVCIDPDKRKIHKKRIIAKYK